MNTKFLTAVCVFLIYAYGARFVQCQSTVPLKTAEEILRNKHALEGRDYRVVGFAQFDRPSWRGFLYGNLGDLRSRNYKKAIFLQLDLEKFSKLRIRDEQYVVVTGYLAEKLHGPLGVYPAHIIVNEIKIGKK